MPRTLRAASELSPQRRERQDVRPGQRLARRPWRQRRDRSRRCRRTQHPPGRCPARSPMPPSWPPCPQALACVDLQLPAACGDDGMPFRGEHQNFDAGGTQEFDPHAVAPIASDDFVARFIHPHTVIGHHTIEVEHEGFRSSGQPCRPHERRLVSVVIRLDLDDERKDLGAGHRVLLHDNAVPHDLHPDRVAVDRLLLAVDTAATSSRAAPTSRHWRGPTAGRRTRRHERPFGRSRRRVARGVARPRDRGRTWTTVTASEEARQRSRAATPERRRTRPARAAPAQHREHPPRGGPTAAGMGLRRRDADQDRPSLRRLSTRRSGQSCDSFAQPGRRLPTGR